MQRYGRGAGRGAGRGGLGGEGDERDGGLRGAAAAVSGGFPSSPHPGGVVHGAGAPVHIPAAGGSKLVLQCRVLLLDGTEVSVELPVSNTVRAEPSARWRRFLAPFSPPAYTCCQVHRASRHGRGPFLLPRSERGERHLRLRPPPQPQPEPLGGSSLPGEPRCLPHVPGCGRASAVSPLPTCGAGAGVPLGRRCGAASELSALPSLPRSGARWVAAVCRFWGRFGVAGTRWVPSRLTAAELRGERRSVAEFGFCQVAVLAAAECLASVPFCCPFPSPVEPSFPARQYCGLSYWENI